MELRPEQSQAAIMLYFKVLYFNLLLSPQQLKGINNKHCWLFAHCKVSLSITRSQKQEEWGCLPLQLPIFQMGSQGRPIQLSFCLVFGSAENNMDIFQLTPQIKAF